MIDAISMDAKRSISTIFELARAIGAGARRGSDGSGQLMTQLKRMEHAIRDLLEADQLARGEVDLHRRSTEIDALLRRVARDFPHPEDRRIDVAAETARSWSTRPGSNGSSTTSCRRPSAAPGPATGSSCG